MSIAKLNDLIDHEKFNHHYQALYDLQTLTTIGYKAYLQTNVFKNLDILFDKVSNSSRFFELEIRSLRKALYEYNKLSVEKKLFLNVYPLNLIHAGMIHYLDFFIEKTDLTPSQLTLEIKEVDIKECSSMMTDTIQTLQQHGYQIALDNVGKQVSSIQAVLELNPDYVKMDRFFAKDLATAVEKQEMIRSIVTYCMHTNTQLILKGVEIPEDLDMAKSMGISIIQGDLLARPEPFSVVKKYELKQEGNIASNE